LGNLLDWDSVSLVYDGQKSSRSRFAIKRLPVVGLRPAIVPIHAHNLAILHNIRMISHNKTYDPPFGGRLDHEYTIKGIRLLATSQSTKDKMVATEDSANAYLLRGHVGQWRSDDVGNIEILFDSEASRDSHENSSSRRSHVLQKFRKNVAHRVRSIAAKNKTRHDWSVQGNKENISPSALAMKAYRSPYDEGSILEKRDGPPLNEQELCDTFSTVSSDLSSSSNQQRRHRLVTHWKSCMKQSVRKLLRKELEDDMKGNPPKYQEFGLHLYPWDTIFDASRDRKRSAFNLLVPTLNTPRGSYDAASDAGQCDNTNDFSLKSGDEIAFEEAMRRREDEGEGLQFPQLLPRTSNLFVSFDNDMAQVIFHTASSETDEFQAVEVHSVGSDIEVISQDSDHCDANVKPTSNSFEPGKPDQYSHRGYKGTPHPSKGTHGLPAPFSNRQNRTFDEEKAFHWIDAPFLDTAVTDPRSSVLIETSRVDPCGVGQVDSKESDATSTDEILKARGQYSPALPEIPLPKYLVDDYPYDEDSNRDDAPHYSDRKRLEPRGRSGVKDILNHGAAAAFVPVGQEDSLRTWYRSNASADKKTKCGCIKCAAKSIYEDLLNCNAGL
jgi:hypothetical protein